MFFLVYGGTTLDVHKYIGRDRERWGQALSERILFVWILREELKSVTDMCPQSPPEVQDTEGGMWPWKREPMTLWLRGGLAPPDQLPPQAAAGGQHTLETQQSFPEKKAR